MVVIFTPIFGVRSNDASAIELMIDEEHYSIKYQSMSGYARINSRRGIVQNETKRDLSPQLLYSDVDITVSIAVRLSISSVLTMSPEIRILQHIEYCGNAIILQAKVFSKDNRFFETLEVLLPHI